MKTAGAYIIFLLIFGVFHGGHRAFAGRPGWWHFPLAFGLFALVYAAGAPQLVIATFAIAWHALTLYDIATLWTAPGLRTHK